MFASDRTPRGIFLIGKCDDRLIPGVLPLATTVIDEIELDLALTHSLHRSYHHEG